MKAGRHRWQPTGSHRLPAVVALVLAVVGASLIATAAASSRAGPPQPAVGVAASADPASSALGSTPRSTATRRASATPPPVPADRPTGSADRPAIAATTPDRSTFSARSSATTGHHPQRATVTATGLILPASPPVSIRIAAIGVMSPLLDLGLNPDGTVQVPPLNDPSSKAGWYRNSPTPGSLGPAIILGHIDSKAYGPGVFYNLGRLTAGQQIEVTRRDGSVAVFRVDAVRSYPKAHFPTLEVYGNIDHAGLRLITCGGTFDPAEGSYQNNIVVYASLASSRNG